MIYYFFSSCPFLSKGNPVEILAGISVASFSNINEVDMVIHFRSLFLWLSPSFC